MMSLKINSKSLPLDGLEGLKQNFSSDVLSGFLVFLLALPLSLGIAKASGFNPIYGLMTAMIGGIVVSLISGSKLTIKGPAAGLIVIVSGSVTDFSAFAPSGVHPAEFGWHLALGAIVVAGIMQVLFGLLKFGSLSDFFPLSAVHGMLAAIGIIIISKQIHILAGVNPMTEAGKPMVEPLELLSLIPNTLAHFFAKKEIAIVGVVSLIIVFGWPMIKSNLTKKIPAPLVVLIVAIPLGMYLNLKNMDKALVSFDKGFFQILGVQVSFEGFSYMGTFIKYVVMFALVGSLEALLTVKAVDMMDSYKRKSDYNKDLMAVGVGNIIAGILGGLPMISEVARSSANVNYGAKTRWSNFFHGLFILVFLIFAVSFSNLIPNAALAAMLIGVGWKLAHPKEFGHMAKIGLDQIAVFITTIIFTLATDLLVGIATGILLKIILHLFRGVAFKSIFNSRMSVQNHTISVKGAIVFSNFIKVKNQILKFPYSSKVILDVNACNFVDHSVIETLHHLKEDFEAEGGHLEIKGIAEFNPITGNKLSAHRKK